ncbi:MAG: bifunctional diaminohydroxyphosphoribosylaminopyrimidine deaminase/5-amino-6-(5-phosphoribosylamino)uracil reductase RibD, partial [bacterium]
MTALLDNLKEWVGAAPDESAAPVESVADSDDSDLSATILTARGDDERFIARALALAANGVNTTHPNPRVGCVLVADGAVVGEGWHRFAGGPHAEIIALKRAGHRARGATAYISLEPCAHHGRTPPCVEALIKAGIARAVIAIEDPNPRVNGAG